MANEAAANSALAGGVAAAAGRPAIVHPCTACRQLRRGCRPGCVFAPCFPPSQPNRFAIVRRVYGAGNVQRLLEELPPERRPAAADSLAYEASMRLRDRVFGAAGVVSLYEHRLHSLQLELLCAKAELSTYECSNRSDADRVPQITDQKFSKVCGGGGGGWGDGWYEAMRVEGCVSEARIAERLAAATDAAVVSVGPVEDQIAATTTATAMAKSSNQTDEDAANNQINKVCFK